MSTTSKKMYPLQVVGFRDEIVMLMPLGEASGIGPDSEVLATGATFNSLW